jgi:hypothetical protein
MSDMMLARPALILAALALSACQFVKPQLAAPPPALVAAPTAPAAITAARALQLFDATCGAALPNFGTIDTALRASGISGSNQTSPTEDVSVRLQDGPGDGKTCAITFGTTDPEPAVRAAFGALGTFQQTPLGVAAKYRGRNAIVIYSGETRRIGATGYFTLRLLSER